MANKITLAMIRTRAVRKCPLGFHASLFMISFGPTVSLPDTALAAEDSTVAPKVHPVSPPYPMKNRTPIMSSNTPSTNKASCVENADLGNSRKNM